MRLLFVCLGNICRSPAAEGILKAKLELQGIYGWHVDSAGTGDYHIGDLPDYRMRQAALRHGYTLDHHCRQVREADFDRFDAIIGMDASNVQNLRRLAPTPEAERKVMPIGRWLPAGCGYDHVPDPYYEGREGFDRTIRLLETACDGIIAEATAKEHSR